MSELERRFVDVIVALGDGEVVSYGDIAEVAGAPGRARAVGHLLATHDGASGVELPWWRVVTSNGRLVPGHEREQRRLLLAEGVIVRDGRVVDAPAGRFRRSPARP